MASSFLPLSRLRRHSTMWAALTLCLVTTLGMGALAVVPRLAHAATTTITTCDAATVSGAISSAAPGDTLKFGCNGTITLASTLTISQNLTLDGSGHSVTLDGNNTVQVLVVNSGVNFTLNGLTISRGTANFGGGLGVVFYRTWRSATH